MDIAIVFRQTHAQRKTLINLSLPIASGQCRDGLVVSTRTSPCLHCRAKHSVGRSQKRGTQSRDRRGRLPAVPASMRINRQCYNGAQVESQTKIETCLHFMCDSTFAAPRTFMRASPRLRRSGCCGRIQPEHRGWPLLPGHQPVQVPSSFRLLSLGASLLPHAQ